MNREIIQAEIWRQLTLGDPNTPCPHCNGQGAITLNVDIKSPLFGQAFHCICRRSEMLTRRVMAALAGAGDSIPQSSYDYDFQDFKAMPAQQASNAAYALVCGTSSKPGLLLYGNTGVGKSTLALITLRYKAGSGQSVCWVDYTDLIKRVQATYNKAYTGPGEDEIIGAIVQADFVVIDDLGSVASAAVASENRIEIMFRVVNGRYTQSRATFITTNLTPDKLKFQFGDRIYSRLVGMCDIIHFGGPDLRIGRSS